jgi:hypothetical protein
MLVCFAGERKGSRTRATVRVSRVQEFHALPKVLPRKY